MPISSEEYHTKLNELLVEVTTKMLRGESSTVGGMDWEDAERFLSLAAEHLGREVSVTVYPEGRLRVVEYLTGEDGAIVAPNIETDVAAHLKEKLADERQGGDPAAFVAAYRRGLEQVIAELAA